jgi:hypothetical protein
VPGIEHSFSGLLTKFMVMLGPEAGTLTQRGRWMQTARLWRFLLLQREDGCFDLTDSLAYALESHEGRRPPKEKKKKSAGFQALVTLFVADGELDENLDDAADAYMSSDDEAAADDDEQPGDAKRYKDCPISFSSTAARNRMPVALLTLSGQRNKRWEQAMARKSQAEKEAELCAVPAGCEDVTEGQPKASASAAQENDVLQQAILALLRDPTPEPRLTPEPEPEPISVQLADRLWATILSLAVMEELDVCWLVDEDDERSIVDAGREWLEARAEEDARIKALLDSGELHKAARIAIKDWKKIMEHSVNMLRRNEVLDQFTALTHVQRASGRVIKSIMTDHGTFATFFDADGYIMRWQRWSACLCASFARVAPALQLTHRAPPPACSDPSHNCDEHPARLHLVLRIARHAVLR